ncbi:hypothetical protein C0J52_05264 [Blattella germanica]|nr:hypothetical protein C0J52_05264 [Blattella germanica]
MQVTNNQGCNRLQLSMTEVSLLRGMSCIRGQLLTNDKEAGADGSGKDNEEEALTCHLTL